MGRWNRAAYRPAPLCFAPCSLACPTGNHHLERHGLDGQPYTCPIQFLPSPSLSWLFLILILVAACFHSSLPSSSLTFCPWFCPIPCIPCTPTLFSFLHSSPVLPAACPVLVLFLHYLEGTLGRVSPAEDQFFCQPVQPANYCPPAPPFCQHHVTWHSATVRLRFAIPIAHLLVVRLFTTHTYTTLPAFLPLRFSTCGSSLFCNRVLTRLLRISTNAPACTIFYTQRTDLAVTPAFSTLTALPIPVHSLPPPH